MAIEHHTHNFELPVASREEVVAGLATDKVVVPASLGSAAVQDASAFASAAQGLKADLAVQPQDLGALALKNRIAVGDIDAAGNRDETRFLRGDGLWAVPVSSGNGGSGGDGGDGGSGAVETIAFYENLIINGGFTIDQRCEKGNPDLGVWAYDRWLNVAEGRQQIVEGVEAGNYALFWEGGGVAKLGENTATSPLIASLAAGNVKIVVPMNAQNVALVHWQDQMPTRNPYQARPFAQELQLCQRYYQKSVNYAQAAHGNQDGHHLLVPVMGAMGKNQLQACLRCPPTVAYYGNGSDEGHIFGVGSFQQSIPLTVETLYANESYCIFANAQNLPSGIIAYKLNFAADAEIIG